MLKTRCCISVMRVSKIL